MVENLTKNEELLPAIVAEAKRIEEDALYSYKGHFEAARKWNTLHLWIGIPTTLAAAIAGVSALANYATLSAVLALLVAATSALFTFLNTKEQSARHQKAGSLFKALRNDARIFHQVKCLQATQPEKLSDTLDELNSRRSTLGLESPQIPRSAYYRARKGIEAGEADYVVDQDEAKA